MSSCTQRGDKSSTRAEPAAPSGATNETKLLPAVRWGIGFTGALAVLIGAFWFAGWLVGDVPAWSWMITPKTNNSLALLLGGCALLLLALGGSHGPLRSVGAFFSVIVLVIGSLTVSEHLFGWDLGIDQLLATEPPGAMGVVSPNRMGPPASISHALMGLALLSMALRRRVAPHLGIAVCVINLVPAVGFLYGVEVLYGKASVTGIAWPTVVAMLALGTGIVLAHTNVGPMSLLLRNDAGGILVRRLLPAVLLVPLVLGFLARQGEYHDLYRSATGTAVLVLLLMTAFSALLWHNAARLSRLSAAERSAKETLRDRDDKLRLVMDTVPALICYVDHDFRYVRVNSSYERWFGRSASEVEGRYVWDMLGEPAWQLVRSELERAVTGEIVTYEQEMPYRDGGPRWVQVTCVPDCDSDGRVRGFVAHVMDIGKRKRVENELLSSTRRRQLLSETASQLLLTEDPQGAVQSLCEKVIATLDCHVFFNFLAHEERGCLHLNAYAGIPEEVGESLEWLDYGAAVCGCVAMDGCRIVAEDIFNNPDPRTELVKGYGVQAYACNPLLAHGGRVIGTLSFGSRTKVRFSQDELDLMKAVADQVATAMERIRLLNVERQRAEELQAVLDAVPAAVWIAHDPKCRKITGNSYANRLLQAPQGSNISRSAPPDDEAVSYRVFRGGAELKPEEMPAQIAAATCNPVSGEVLELLFVDGRRLHLIEGAVPLFDDKGRVRGAVAAGADVTPLKLAEERQRELEAQQKEFYRRTILAATCGKLEVTHRDEMGKLLGEPLGRWEFGEGSQLAGVRESVSSIAQSNGLTGQALQPLICCVGEATSNALKHAGAGKACLCRNHCGLVFAVEDNGRGIGSLNLPDVALTMGYSTAGTGGLGYKMMIRSADKVYLATGPDGTTVACEFFVNCE